ncbi:unnamed protein product [Chironomus riparius]|uniref:Large ribosomal subunit protein bL34m n=1 Tax=Chironomus riparius TaxID=315576 RepID=A0A9N9WSD9_9DIPT|nr:unnamed protein product [Chironomus riparius]
MLQLVKSVGSFLQRSTHVLCNTSLITSNALAIEPNTAWSKVFLRTNIRNNFPRAREGKRVKVHGWKTRLSTLNGKQILWRRILKGRHVLSH